MKTKIWPALFLILFLGGCAAGGYSGYQPYQPSPYEDPYYYYQAPPPLPVSPYSLGSIPGGEVPGSGFRGPS